MEKSHCSHRNGSCAFASQNRYFLSPSDTVFHVNLFNVKSRGVQVTIESNMGTPASRKIVMLNAGSLQQIRQGNLKWYRQLTSLIRADFWRPGSTLLGIFSCCVQKVKFLL